MDLSRSKAYRGHELVVVNAAFLAGAYLAVALRCFVRLRITKSFHMEDYLMVAALGLFTLYAAFVFAGVTAGLGRHNASLPPGLAIRALEFVDLSTIIYFPLLAAIKCSIGMFLLRIAVRPVYQWILKISMAILVIWSLATLLFAIFSCHPVAFQWDPTIEGGTCVSNDSIIAASYSYSAMAIVSDFLFALLPIPMIWKVNMTIQTKVVVAGILFLGIFASIAELIRLKYLSDIAEASDLLFTATDASIWTTVEIGLAIIAASIVTLRPLLRTWKVKGFSRSDLTDGSAHRGTRNSRIQAGGVYMRSLDHEVDKRQKRIPLRTIGLPKPLQVPMHVNASKLNGSQDAMLLPRFVERVGIGGTRLR